MITRRNKKVVIHEIKFDSKRESERYNELLIMKKAGLITDLVLQPKFKLKMETQSIRREISYVADFRYKEVRSGRIIVEDTITDNIEIKESIKKGERLLRQYGELYDFRIVK